MDAYRAVISLHNLGYQLKVFEGDKIMIRPELAGEHKKLIMALLREPQEACKAIRLLPSLCAVRIPKQQWIRQYALSLFKALQETGYIRIITVIYCSVTGETEWVYVPEHALGYKSMRDIVENDWGDYYECKEERQRWRT